MVYWHPKLSPDSAKMGPCSSVPLQFLFLSSMSVWEKCEFLVISKRSLPFCFWPAESKWLIPTWYPTLPSWNHATESPLKEVQETAEWITSILGWGWICTREETLLSVSMTLFFLVKLARWICSCLRCSGSLSSGLRSVLWFNTSYKFVLLNSEPAEWKSTRKKCAELEYCHSPKIPAFGRWRQGLRQLHKHKTTPGHSSAHL